MKKKLDVLVPLIATFLFVSLGNILNRQGPPEASAAVHTFLSFSTCTFRVLTISTGVFRVDNFGGAGEGLLSNRNYVLLQASSAAADFFCGYNTDVSTIPSNAKAGRRITGTTPVELNLGADLQYHCQTIGVTTNTNTDIHVEQCSWRR